MRKMAIEEGLFSLIREQVLAELMEFKLREENFLALRPRTVDTDRICSYYIFVLVLDPVKNLFGGITNDKIIVAVMRKR